MRSFFVLTHRKSNNTQNAHVSHQTRHVAMKADAQDNSTSSFLHVFKIIIIIKNSIYTHIALLEKSLKLIFLLK